MKKLPLGYVAVSSEKPLSKTFAFKGEEYAVVPGKTVFSSLHEAAGVQNASVILFSEGRHTIDKFAVTKPLTLLGQNAEISPNKKSRKRLSPPALSLERKKNESVLCGSYWFGKIWIEKPVSLTVDGFTLDGVRFVDEVKLKGNEKLCFKNLVYSSSCGDHLFKFPEIPEGSSVTREVLFENIRFYKKSGLDSGKNFCLLSANRATFDGICFCGTDKNFGFTDIARQYKNCPENSKKCEFTVKNSFFSDNCGEHIISLFAGEGKKAHLTVENTVFISSENAENSPIDPLLSKASDITVSNCSFISKKPALKPAVFVSGNCRSVNFQKTLTEGFTNTCGYAAPLPEKAPSSIKNTAHKTKCEDPHEVIDINKADFKPLDRLYKGRKVYYGDLHAHSNSGGKSDGKTPIEVYTREMDRLSIDFTALVDHRQMRGYFLPEWDKERFIYGMEPGTRFPWAKSAEKGYDKVHYCMLFPHEYGLAMVFANFPEFEFKGDELNGFCKYPVFSKERFSELVSYINSIGGLIVHPHPKDLMASSNPLDYSFGEHTFLETISVSAWDNMSYKNYKLWDSLLKLGCHIYTSGGADAHGNITNAAVSTFYTKEKSGLAFFKQMKSGDFTVGFAGIKLSVGDSPMGSEISYKKGQVLTLKAGDFFPPHYKKDHIYELRVFTDKGLCYSSIFGGKAVQKLAIKVKKRRYYRADIFDLTAGYTVAISNPLWLDKK